MINFAVVIPAYNEEKYIGATLDAICESVSRMPLSEAAAEIIVVDHSSTDSTVSESKKANRVLSLPRGCSIGAVRNYGASQSCNPDFLVFVDADTIVPPLLLPRLLTYAKDGIAGGAVRGKYSTNKLSMRLYARFWDWYAMRSPLPMTQGICQFARRDLFEAVDGYDDSLWFAEDTDFYWRIYTYAESHDLTLAIPADLHVSPSSRRMDKWPVWKMIFWTNPWMSRFRLHSKRHWRRWYEDQSTR